MAGFPDEEGMAAAAGLAGAVPLVCHPGSPAPWVRRIEAAVAWRDGGLDLAYTLEGDLDRLRIPAPETSPPMPPRADGLWRHTCFEAFVHGADAPGYHEYNFSPAGQWQAYAFSAYREGGAPAQAEDPGIVCRRTQGRLTLRARVLPSEARLRLGLAAVVEDRDGALSYWALAHPAERPDFHLPASFVLEFHRL
jgi:hypothetical protein